MPALPLLRRQWLIPAAHTARPTRRAVTLPGGLESKSPRQWHLGRIKWFVQYPKTISETEIEIVADHGLYVADGNHRMMAAYALGRKTIPVKFYGDDGDWSLLRFNIQLQFLP